MRALLTSDGQAGASLFCTSLNRVKDARVASFVPEADSLEGDGRGVLRGGGELHVLLPAHTVLIARLVAE